MCITQEKKINEQRKLKNRHTSYQKQQLMSTLSHHGFLEFNVKCRSKKKKKKKQFEQKKYLSQKIGTKECKRKNKITGNKVKNNVK